MKGISGSGPKLSFARVPIVIRKIKSPNQDNRESCNAQDKTCEAQHKSRVGTRIENDIRTDPDNKQERKHCNIANHRYLLAPGKSLG